MSNIRIEELIHEFPAQVGLGTDCSGGYSPSMLNSMRTAVTASNTLAFAGTQGEL